MAEVLRFENHDATTTFDLLSDIGVVAGSQRFNTKDNRVIETYRLAKFAALRSDIRTAVRSLEDMLIDMVRWHEDVLLSDSVWMRRAIDGETAKRALVYSFEFQQIDSEAIGVLLHGKPAAVYELAVTRDAEYEAVTASSASSTVNADFIGGVWDVSGSISGGAFPSRIAAMRFRTQQDIGRFWAGFRKVRGGFANFDPIWECESGSYSSGTAEFTDATASPGSGVSKVTTDFDSGVGADMNWRVNMRFEVQYGTTAEAEDMVGRYHVIARLHTGNAATEFGVKMVMGFASSVYQSTANQIHYETQHIAPGHTNWFLAPLGTIEIPSGGIRQITIDNLTIADVVHDLEVRLWAERTSGTGDLDWDCLLLVPADHCIRVDGIEKVAVTDDDVWVFTEENGRLSCYMHQTTGIVVERPSVSDVGIESWAYPEDGGLLVVAAERIGDSNWGDVFDEFHVEDLFKRFLTYHD